MKVLFLSDVWPNNILGRWAGYEKSRGNDVYRRCGNPDKIICSWNFRRNGQQLLNLNGAEVIEGGPFVDPELKAPSEIAHRMPDYNFLGIDYALGRLTSGCPHDCGFCIVSKCWGRKTKEYDYLDNFLPTGWNRVMLLDDNILACHNSLEILEDLASRKIKVCFQSGVDARLVTEKKAEALSRVDYRSRNFRDRYLYIAFDLTENEEKIQRGIEILQSHGIHLCGYAIGGYPNGDEFKDLFYRVSRLIEWKVDPFVMPYANPCKDIRDFKRFISLRYYRRYVKEDPEHGLKRAWNKYRRRNK